MKKKIKGFDSQKLVSRIGKKKSNYVPNKFKLFEKLKDIIKDGDNIVFLGAGPITKLAHEFAKKIKKTMTQINNKLIYKFLGKINFNYNIGKRTWFGTGGKCLIFFEPSNIKQLFFFLKIIPRKFPFFILGLGSNILFRDGRFNGAVIKLGEEFKKIELHKKKKIIKVGCGVKDIDLANFCLNNSISSFEFLVGIPGTLGGAIRMNSSCFNGCISDNLKSITVLNSKRELKKINKDEIKFDYREIKLPKDYIFLEAEFFINFKNKIKIKEKMKNIKKILEKKINLLVSERGEVRLKTQNISKPGSLLIK